MAELNTLDGAANDGHVQRMLHEFQRMEFLGSGEHERSLDGMIRYFKGRIPRERRWFRWSGMTVIVLSALMPVLAVYGDKICWGKTCFASGALVSIAAAGVALLTGASGFFHWHTTWKNQTAALFGLQELKAGWDASVVAALLNEDPQEGVRILREAYAQLVANAYAIARSEMQEFFQLQRFPDVPAEAKRS